MLYMKLPVELFVSADISFSLTYFVLHTWELCQLYHVNIVTRIHTVSHLHIHSLLFCGTFELAFLVHHVETIYCYVPVDSNLPLCCIDVQGYIFNCLLTTL